jgi:hypothetical protein
LACVRLRCANRARPLHCHTLKWKRKAKNSTAKCAKSRQVKPDSRSVQGYTTNSRHTEQSPTERPFSTWRDFAYFAVSIFDCIYLYPSIPTTPDRKRTRGGAVTDTHILRCGVLLAGQQKGPVKVLVVQGFINTAFHLRCATLATNRSLPAMAR